MRNNGGITLVWCPPDAVLQRIEEQYGRLPEHDAGLLAEKVQVTRRNMEGEIGIAVCQAPAAQSVECAVRECSADRIGITSVKLKLKAHG